MLKSLEFEDVVLIPRIVSTILSRDDIKINVKFGDYTITSPIVASPMQDVCDGSIAGAIKKLGGMGIIHRFSSIEDQKEQFIKANDDSKTGVVACAIGVDGDAIERFNVLYNEGCQNFCVDTANGANLRTQYIIEKLSDKNINIIAGNVASAECYKWLEQFDKVQAIRVGIAGGAACTTKNATGVYYGMASCIQECYLVKERTLLIADGGIKEPADFCKAVALGSDLVMMGSAIAATIDSPAELINKDGKLFKVYHGSASFEIQKKYRERPKYIEGTTRLLPYNNESLDSLLSRYLDGLKSSMSYFNAVNFIDFRKNVSFGCKK